MVGALAILGFLLLSGGGTAQANHLVAPTTIDIYAVDTNTAGNTATSVNGPDPTHPASVNPVDQCRDGFTAADVIANTTFDIDIIVDQVPATGMASFGVDLIYNPAVLNVAAVNGSMLINATLPLGTIINPGTDSTPDADGDFTASYVDLGGGVDVGEGVLLRLTMKIVGAGHSPLDITTDPFTLGNPSVNDGGGSPYTLDHKNNGDVYVVSSCPTPMDLKMLSVTTTSPGTTQAAGVSFPVTVDAVVHNNGTGTSASSIVDETLSMPGDCTAAGGPTRHLTGLSFPVSIATAVATQTFTVTCTGPSAHSFSATAAVSADPLDLSVFDPNTTNNSGASSSVNTNVTVSADFGITGTSIAIAGATTACLPQSPPPTCVGAPFPRMLIGNTYTITITKTLHNNGPFGPVPVSDSVAYSAANSVRVHMANSSPAGLVSCTVTPTNLNPKTASLAVSTAQTLTFTFSVTCASDSFGSPAAESGAACTDAVDSDGDGFVNEGCPAVGIAESGAQCLNSTDDDADGLINEGCPAVSGPSEFSTQCDNAIDDDADGAVNDGCPNDGFGESSCTDAVDSDGDGTVNDGCTNIDPQILVLTFFDTLSSTDNHILDAPGGKPNFVPITINLWNTKPFNPVIQMTDDDTATPNDPFATPPLTDNCKTNTVAFPGGIPCEMLDKHGSGNQGLGIEPLFLETTTISSTAFTIASGHPALGGAANGTLVGAVGFQIGTQSGTVCSGTVQNPTYPVPNIPITDGALPDWAFTNPGSTVASTWVANGGIPTEGPNNATISALASPLVWPIRLEADPGAKALHSLGLPLIARYVGLSTLGIPFNILVFNTGATYYNEVIVGNPTGLSIAGAFCGPYNVITDYMGSTTTGAILRQCNAVGTFVSVGSFTRADDGEGATPIDTMSCSPSDTSVTMAKDEHLGDGNPAGDEIDGGITYTKTVTFTVLGSGTLSMSIVGPAVCNPHWTNPLDSFPSNIAGVQTSTVTYGFTSGVVTATYSFNCPNVPGDYTFQIIGNLTGGAGEDMSNNQVENHVSVHVVVDIDGDHIQNNLDACPTVPEDHDGLHGAEIAAGVEDGCPDTDVGVTVVKEENYNVNVSVDTHKTVTITVTNGNVAAGVLVHILAVSQIGQCEVRLVPHPGDSYSEFYTEEGSGPLNPDTLNSQIEFTVPMGANTSLVLSYDYIIHCFQKSSHSPAFELQVDAIPLAPVVEENLGLDQFPCGNAGHSTSDNIHKNCPSVTAWEKADLAKGPCTLASVATIPGGTSFTVTSTCTVHNNGPFGDGPSGPVTFSDVMTLSGPFSPDCTAVEPLVHTENGSLTATGATSTTSVQYVWHVTCTNPSFHTFTVNDTVTLTGPIHVYDPCPNPPAGPVPGQPTCADNNSGSASSTTAVTTTTDPSVTAGSLNCNTPVEVGATITCTETDTVVLAGASSATIAAMLSVSDCTITSANNGVPVAAVNGANAFTWTLTCASPSDHTITKNVVLTPTFPLHVSDSNPNNNSGTASTVVVVLLHPALTVAITNVTTPEIDIVGTTTTVSPHVVISSVPSGVAIAWTAVWGNAGPTVACTGAVNSSGTGTTTVTLDLTATLTVPASAHECSFSLTVCADATANHVIAHQCTTISSTIESDVLVVKYVILVGPAAVNLSDTNGRYMWVISEIGNLASDAELVHINMSISPAVPNGCSGVVNQILPGQSQFFLSSHEQKVLVWRVRYECHSPATAQVINQTVKVGVTHCDTTTSAPAAGVAGTVTATAPGGICDPNTETGTVANGDVETFLSDNTKTTTKQVIIQ
jgi:hypothetical protein